MRAGDRRPLGLGEVLDRAVTILVRRFAPIVSAIAVTYVPLLVLQWALLGDLFASQRSTLTASEWQRFAVTMIPGLIAFALARTAAIVAARDATPRGVAGLRTAYRAALRRFPAQLAAALAFTLAFAVALAAVVALIVAVLFLERISGVRAPAAIILAEMFGIAIVLLGPLTTWMYLAYQLATVTIVDGTEGPLRAQRTMLRRTAFRRPFASLFAGGALLAVTVGVSIGYGLLVQMLPNAALRFAAAAAAGSAVTLATEAFTVAFVVAYEADIAVRFRGTDLLAALDAGEADAIPV